MLKAARLAVINGDDFGFSHGVNQAIIRAHEGGILTSTSLMVSGEAFAAAVELALARPRLAVGLHLVLVCGKSVLPPAEIPHLVDRAGNFPQAPVWAGLNYQFSPAARGELYREIRAQLQKFRHTGLPLSHLDGHLHLHCHPVVLQIVSELAEEFEIGFIRLPWEESQFTLAVDPANRWSKLIESFVFARLRRYGEKLLRAKGIKFADRVYGLLQTGKVSESYLLELIPQIQANFIEIYAHPAIHLPGENFNGPPGAGKLELEALLSQNVRQALVSSGFILTNFQEN